MVVSHADAHPHSSYLWTGYPVSGIIGGPLAGWLLTVFADPNGANGWRALMLCEGVPSILVGLWMLMVLPDTPHQARWLTTEEAKGISAASKLRDAVPRPVTLRQILDTLRSPAVWRLSVTHFMLVGGTFGIVLWLPQFLRRPGWETPQIIGWISTIPWVIGSLTILAVSRIADRKRNFSTAAAISASARQWLSARQGLLKTDGWS